MATTSRQNLMHALCHIGVHPAANTPSSPSRLNLSGMQSLHYSSQVLIELHLKATCCNFEHNTTPATRRERDVVLPRLCLRETNCLPRNMSVQSKIRLHLEKRAGSAPTHSHTATSSFSLPDHMEPYKEQTWKWWCWRRSTMNLEAPAE